ncbi:hypothetical protein H0W91_03295 [Patescibacteria group bacterium]|nr:hypothetical protein [Patescibacteria group bacterium]
MSLLSFFVLGFLFSASSVEASTRIGGYTTKKGTYVQPYQRSSPNSSKYDNYSSKGNSNPYTGKKGYVKPYKW